MLAKTYAKKIEGGNAYRIFLLVLHLVLWLAVTAVGLLYLFEKLKDIAFFGAIAKVLNGVSEPILGALEGLLPVSASLEVMMVVVLALFFLLLWAWVRLLGVSYIYVVTNAGTALHVAKRYQRFAPSALSVEVAGVEKTDLFWFHDVMMYEPTKPRIFVRARSMALFTRCALPAEAPVAEPATVAPAAPVEKKPEKPIEPEIQVIIREAEAREAALAAAPAPVAPTPVAEPVSAPAPIVEEAPVAAPASPENEDGDDEEESEIREVTVDGRTFQMVIRYSRSFTARVTQADDTLKNYYSEIKNELLSYDLVKSRISWKHDAFNRGRLQLAKLVVRGKNLCVYLALDPNAYEVEKYHQVDQGNKNAYAKVPMMVRVKSDLGLRKAKFLISEMMANYEIEKGENEAIDYASQYTYKDTKTLIAENLIKELQGGELPQ